MLTLSKKHVVVDFEGNVVSQGPVFKSLQIRLSPSLQCAGYAWDKVA
jgi:hypothetical protein